MMTKATGMMVAFMAFMVVMAAMLTSCGDAWAGQTWICAVSSAVAVDEDGTVGPPDLGDGVVWSVFGHALPEGESEEQVEGTPSVTPESASGERIERDSDELTESDSDEPAKSDSDELTDNEPAARSADDSH